MELSFFLICIRKNYHKKNSQINSKKRNDMFSRTDSGDWYTFSQGFRYTLFLKRILGSRKKGTFYKLLEELSLQKMSMPKDGYLKMFRIGGN